MICGIYDFSSLDINYQNPRHCPVKTFLFFAANSMTLSGYLLFCKLI